MLKSVILFIGHAMRHHLGCCEPWCAFCLEASHYAGYHEPYGGDKNE